MWPSGCRPQASRGAVYGGSSLGCWAQSIPELSSNSRI